MMQGGEVETPKIVVIGEAPGEIEDRYKTPFIGPAGMELYDELHESGFLPPGSVGHLRALLMEAIGNFRDGWLSKADQMYLRQIIPLRDAMLKDAGICLVNATDHRPPFNEIEKFFYTKTKAPPGSLFRGRYCAPEIVEGSNNLHALLTRVKPELTVCLGATATWQATGRLGITKWRGSELEGIHGGLSVPTWHPAAVLRQWALRYIAVQDLRRAKRVMPFGVRKPQWQFTTRPSFQQAVDLIRYALSHPSPWLVCDTETRGGHIACVGVGVSKTEAFCIPFMCVERPEGYWSMEEERALVLLLRELLTTRDIVFQNGAYDLQYFAKEWGYLPKILHDTMLAQHVLWAGLRKALDFQASLYCDQYVYWKDDGKEWDTSIPEDQYWRYNCEDCARTYECAEVELDLLTNQGLMEQYRFQMRVLQSAVKMMLRGVRLDLEHKRKLVKDLGNDMDEVMLWLEKVLGHSINPRSFPQMSTLFLTDFECKPVLNRKTKRPSFDDDSLTVISNRKPLTRPLTRGIAHYRSLGVLKSTFAEMQPSPDNRLRTSNNLTGAETYRWSSSEDAFGYGGNLQNIPRVEE